MSQLTISDLKTRGWTAAGIRRFLGQPDDTKANPLYRRAAPIKLYNISRVDAIEKTDEYQEWKTKSDARRTVARQRAHKKREELINVANEVVITVKKLSRKKVIARAIKAYNYNKYNQGKFHAMCPVNVDTDSEFIRRITVNFIRHQLCKYDQILAGNKGKVGVAHAYKIVKRRTLDKIAKVYPYLLEECYRQKNEMIDETPSE